MISKVIRVISGRGMTKAIGMKGRGQGVARIVTHPTLKPFINNELDLAIRNPIHFVGAGSGFLIIFLTFIFFKHIVSKVDCRQVKRTWTKLLVKRG